MYTACAYCTEIYLRQGTQVIHLKNTVEGRRKNRKYQYRRTQGVDRYYAKHKEPIENVTYLYILRNFAEVDCLSRSKA